MRVLVTGSEGYIGSVLCPSLESRGHQVKRFDKQLGNEITDLFQVREAAQDVDLIVHLAAIVGYPACERNPELAKDVNIKGSDNVASCNKRTIFSSILTTFAYTVVTEDTPVTPLSLYAETKLEAERRLQNGNIILRFGTLYGVSPSMRGDLLVHSFIREAARENKISLFQPYYMRAITSLGDVVNAVILFIAGDYYGIYNVVSLNMDKLQIAEAVQKVTGCEIKIVPGQDLEERNYIASTDKIRKLGFSFQPDLDKNISEIAGYYKKWII